MKSSQPRLRTLSPNTRRHLTGWLFIGPVVLGVVAFQFAPVLISGFASLTDWNGLTPPHFEGLSNYTTLFTDDPLFYVTLKNTLVFTAGSIVLTIAIGLALALLANQPLRGIGIFRAAFFTPVVTNVVAVGFVWFWLYRPGDGFFDGLLGKLGVDGPSWLTDSHWALFAVVLVSVWQGVGYPMVILLSGLQSIPPSLYEAARVDGASSWTRFWKITLPLLTPQLFFLTIMQFITSFQVFGLIYVMTHGGPGTSTSVYIFQIYQVAFSQGKFGYASAMGWVLFLVVALVTYAQMKLEKRWVFYG